jgi:hypothetical protein
MVYHQQYFCTNIIVKELNIVNNYKNVRKA